MSSKLLNCRLVTPTDKLLDEPVTYASIPAWDGLMGVMPGHAPFVARLGLGVLRLEFPKDTHGGGDRTYYVDGGFVKISNDDVIILAERAIPSEQITETDARAELAEAEARAIPADAANKADAAEAIRLDRERARLKLRMAGARRGQGI